MYCIDLASGQIKWKHTSCSAVFNMSPYRSDDRPLLSSPVIAGSQVFFGSADGFIYCLDIETGKELWSFEIGVPVMSTPLISGNMLYVAAYDRSEEHTSELQSLMRISYAVFCLKKKKNKKNKKKNIKK